MTRPSPERLALLRRMLAEQGLGAPLGRSIPRRPGAGPAPVSFGQRRLWVEERLHPGTSLYNDSLCVSLAGGALDEELVERSLAEVVARHEVLRTGFEERDGEPLQVVRPRARLALRRADLRALAPEARAAELERLLLEDVRAPFDLAAPPLARASLVRVADDAWELGLTMHHLVSDGVSYSILWRELGRLYAAGGAPDALEPLPIQFADFAAWERARADEERVRAGLDFWVRALGRERPALELPLDFPRPAAPAHRGAFCRFRFPPELCAALERSCRREQGTSNQVLVAAYCALFSSLSGQTDLTIGMPSSTRRLPELEGLIGFFVQTRLLRNDLSGDPSFAELLARTRERTLAAAAWDDVPFDRVVRAIRPEGAGETPLIQAWIAPMKDLMPKLELAGLSSRYRIVDPRNARFDLCLILDETAAGVEAYFEYDVDLFRAATVRALAERYLALLRIVLEHPETRLSSLAAALARLAPLPAQDAPRRAGPRRIEAARRRVETGRRTP